MPTPTYVAIAKTVLTGSQASVTFSSIPSTYTDLLVLFSVRGDATYEANNSDTMALRINGSSTTQYPVTYLSANYGSVGSGSRTTGNADSFTRIYSGVNLNSATANTFTNGELYIPNYLASTNKPISSTSTWENNSATDAGISANAGLWGNTNAINSLEFTYTFNASSRFVSGSRFDLYGIKNS